MSTSAKMQLESVRHLDVNSLCRRAAYHRSVIGRVTTSEVRRALSGICHLYGLHAVANKQDRFEVVLHGLASELFPREVLLRQIGLSIGIANPRRQERILDSLQAALWNEIYASPASRCYLRGFGVFSASGTSRDATGVLFFEDSLAGPFSLESQNGSSYFTTAR